MTPNYHNIFKDMINKNYPNLKINCEIILQKEILSVLDVIALNKILSGNLNDDLRNKDQKYRAYNECAIIEILQYGQKHKFNNTHLAKHFNLSRNTVAKWKKIFLL
ncbi:hypothetical protein BA768_09970 [Chryseobacterium sp. CBo1]|uniref:hypothetical protein n=1 Tax=Chryseobacterium sp. CBo1 TaxID=1869230 RepID=UPI0008104018|nr:hypothetical protein [Chryseobacterium sp. CBo1]OCK52955.1 hypothetical protein BA768_09970 [Chryseobacterium sp. CBo1]